MYSGVIRQAQIWLSSRTHHTCLQVRKVKAHQTFHDGMSQQERWLATGNDLADMHAMRAEQLFSATPELNVLLSEAHMSRAQIVLKLAAAVLPLWPRDEKYQRTVSIHTGVSASSDAPLPYGTRTNMPVDATSSMPDWYHIWIPCPQGFYCIRCRATCKAAVVDKRRRQRCKGLVDNLMPAGCNPQGHHLVVSDFPEGQVTICSTCGHWAQV